MVKVSVIGAGSWGTALATVLASKDIKVDLWARNKEQLADMREHRENKKYLPGVTLSENINMVDNLGDAIKGSSAVLFSVPTQAFRENFKNALEFLTDDMVVINVAKGFELGSLKRISQIAEELKPNVKFCVLSGPSHAEEVGKRLPTAVSCVSSNKEVSEYVQDLFFTDRFRTYVNDDLVGVEVGSALKNIIALGTGISDGMGFGDNAKAGIMTRGLTEIARLGLALGAKRETFLGLTGVGDLIVTCTSMHSRNRRCGMLIGQGKTPKEATLEIGMVVESMYTTEAAYELAKKVGVEMPITHIIYDIIKGKVTADDAVEILMGREKKNEKI